MAGRSLPSAVILMNLTGLPRTPLEADVADPFSVQRAVTAASQEADEASLFVYAAGISRPSRRAK